ncbi:S8 family serine peptidase [Yinghuangia sp. KLBMP8922]|uniref:S8 family serine peptidase n=1 Tax=Yinghuangia soli TaxID=2908204 RepID=A0AA41Q4F6_9ACTN|nr:S8 family serine peptidase [Yinghuangia soli]
MALVDGGVDLAHPDLVGQVTLAQFNGGVNIPTRHGTSMASLIAGSGKGVGGQGAFGVAPKARVLAFSVPESGSKDLDSDKTTEAIRAAADSPAKIISLSLGSGRNPIRSEAIAYALKKGKLVIAASGNVEEAYPRPAYPAADPGVLGVGGYDQSGRLSPGSVTGNWVSLAGPGVDIVSACTGPTGYCKGTGTSDATALTAGVAALLWAQRPEYTANQIIKVLIDSANKPEGPLPNDSLGYGNVSPRKALGWTGDPGPPDVNPLVGKRGNLPSPSAASPVDQTTPSQSAAAPGGAQSAPESSAAAAGSAAEKSDGGGSNTLVVVAIVGGGVIAIAVSVGLLLRSRRNRGGPGGPPPSMPNSAPPYGASYPPGPPPPGSYR